MNGRFWPVPTVVLNRFYEKIMSEPRFYPCNGQKGWVYYEVSNRRGAINMSSFLKAGTADEGK